MKLFRSKQHDLGIFNYLSYATICASLVLFVYFFIQGQIANAALTGFFTLLMVYVLYIDIKLHKFVYFLLILSVFLNLLGYVFEFYTIIPYYDNVLHAYTIFAVTTSVSLQLFPDFINQHRAKTPYVIFTLVAVGCAIGSWWEIFEWVFDSYTSWNAIKDFNDSFTDMIANTIGAIYGAFLAMRLTED